MSEPDFICIGAQKSATTYVCKVLKTHSEIQIPTKEFYFFSSKGEYKDDENPAQMNYDKSLQWYKNQFEDDERVKGEISTHYITDCQAANRIKKAFPEIKIFAMLRDPVKRAYSQYFQERYKHCRENRPLEEIIENESDNEIIERGYYYKQLKPYFDLFDRDQIKVFLLDDFKETPEHFFEQLFSFLGVDPSEKPKALQEKENTSKKSRFPVLIKIRRSIRKMIQLTPGGDRLLRKMDELGIIRAILNLTQSINRTDADYDKVPDNIKEKLKEIYKEDIEKLEELIDKDLSDWK